MHRKNLYIHFHLKSHGGVTVDWFQHHSIKNTYNILCNVWVVLKKVHVERGKK